MRIFKYLLLLSAILSIIFTSTSCERDDICAEGTPTTPLLIIKFLDFDTGTEIKAPVELQVKAVDVETIFTLSGVTDSIAIPLKTNEAITDYEFTINSIFENDSIPLNTDTVSFQYTLEQEYVSSACGFRVNYRGLTASPPQSGDDGSWIRNITIQREDVTDETTAHIFIFH
ncbi:DUF6452 family protein [Aquimarina mytili]|uniref:Uncharacterized protein n=1 Tax=Aquimarina mytili TaxID=874423 RepID=A0A937A1U9_9FLAO|nr:DUF6452 family protein [Aquimarina mytili]MBL0685935.1 hypothetical protein [Aquimarina mytili]